MLIVSIDIGIEHLGLIAGTLHPNYNINTIIHCELVDLTRHCTKKGCTLPHSNTITDRMIHFFDSYDSLLSQADCILIERQMPCSGLVAIQSLIHYKYREKSTLVSPNSMHAFYGIGHLDYEGRKRATIMLAHNALLDQKEFVFNEKKDDLADAWCYLNKYSKEKNKVYEEEKQKEEWRKNNQKFIKDISVFRYTPEVDTLSVKMEEMELS